MRVGAGKEALAKERQGQDRVRSAAFNHNQCNQKNDRQAEQHPSHRRTDFKEPHEQGDDGGAQQHRTRIVDAWLDCLVDMAILHGKPHHHRCNNAGNDIDVKDPVPRNLIDQKATQQRPYHR